MPATTRERRPNILTILADDLGIGDVPAYSPSATVPMPAVDALAAGGVRFTDFHTAPLCAPSRYVLLSGNYQHRGRSWSGTWNLGDGSQFRRGQRSLAHALAAAGYKTAIFGKWGIGANVSAPHRSCSYNCAVSWVLSNQSDHRIRGGPSALGFGTSFTSPSGIQMPPYAYWEGPNLVGEARDAMCWPAGARPNANGVSISGIADNSFGHRTRRSVDVCSGGPNGMPYWASNNYDINMTSRALSFLESRHAAQRTDGAPFFLHVCTAAVHEPHTPPRVAFGVTVAGTTPTPFTDMLASLDLTVGQLLAKLKALNELKHTIVAFMSDNGGLCQGSLAVSQGQCARDSSGGLRGHKGELYEGGHRVPLLIRWDGGPVARGAVRSQLVGLSDIYATLLDLVDAPPPAAGQAVDSVSFKQLLLPEGARAPAGRDTWCVLDASSRASNATVSAQPLRRNRRRLRAADPPRWAIRKEHWKLIGRSNAKGAPVAEELYHLGEDLAESTNLLRSSSRRRSDAAAVVDFGLSFARRVCLERGGRS